MAPILLDTCVWGGAFEILKSLGLQVEWTGEWKADPGDKYVLEYAYVHRMILVTLDKDFGELAILKGKLHFGIIRLSGFQAKKQADVIYFILTNYNQELIKGAIITVDPNKVRIRGAPTTEQEN